MGRHPREIRGWWQLVSVRAVVSDGNGRGQNGGKTVRFPDGFRRPDLGGLLKGVKLLGSCAIPRVREDQGA
eukprot:scaffold8649_cov185-Amphora_coffeaeformis.AAC.4